MTLRQGVLNFQSSLAVTREKARGVSLGESRGIRPAVLVIWRPEITALAGWWESVAIL